MTKLFDQHILHIEQVDWRVVECQFDYDISDHHGNLLATVREPKQHIWKRAFWNLVRTNYIAEHFMHADGPDGEPLFGVEKQNELRGSVAHLMVPDIGVIGSVKRVNLLKRVHPHFRVRDDKNNLVAEVQATAGGQPYYQWNYCILDPEGNEIAKILQPGVDPTVYTMGLRDSQTLRMKAELPEAVRILLITAFVAIAWFSDEAGAR